MYLCTHSVGLQVLPFIDNCHLGRIIRFHRFSFYHRTTCAFSSCNITLMSR